MIALIRVARATLHRLATTTCQIGGSLAIATGAFAQITINEVRIDQPAGGVDNDEYFELAGTPGTSLDGYWYLVLGDSTLDNGGVVEAAVDLTGYSIAFDGCFVAAETTMTLAVPDAVFSSGELNFENDDNVTHLLVDTFVGSLYIDLDIDNDGVLDIQPWVSIIDSVALINSGGSGDHVYSTTQVGPDGFYVPGHVLRQPGGTGNWIVGSYGTFCIDTPGYPNTVVPSPRASAAWRNGGTNHDVYTLSGPPIMGRTIIASIDCSGLGHDFALLAGYDNPYSLTIGMNRTVLVDISGPELLSLNPDAATPTANYYLGVPSDCIFAGFTLSTQAAVFTMSTPPIIWELTNAQDMVVGF